MRKNTASQIVSFQAISTTDGSDVTSGSPAVYYTIDGGTQATGSGTTTHEGNGQWSYAPAQAETNGNHVAFTFVLSGAVSQTVNVYPVAFDPTDAADLGVTALTGHTPQTGDSFARLGAPAGASISADIATVDGVVDSVLVDTGTTLPATLSTMEGKIDTVDGVADSILVDTNELQTDWANGGRLDLILDARASQASVDTVDSNVDAILVDTGTTLPATLSTIEGKIDTVDGVADAILVDTNELQTDWADGGRLDAILDARATQTSVDTIDGIVDSILDDTGTSGVVLANNSVTASVIATDAIDADALAADAVGEIADGVWDEAKSGHNVAGSFGKAVRQIQEGIISDESTVNDASATTTSFVTALTETTDDYYNQKVITFIDGNLSGQSRVISDYNGTTKTITVDEAFTEAPANGDGFIVLAFHQHTITEIKTEVRSEMDSNSTQLAAIVEDTGTTIPATLTSLDGKIDTIDGNVDSILVDTSTTIPASITTIDTNVDAILVDTGSTIPAQITALNDISVSDVLTTAMTESYGTDGSDVTLAQACYLIMGNVSEFAISGTTKTVKQLDGSSTAATYTLDDATSPTSITRAT